MKRQGKNDTPFYKEKNINPKKNRVGDCVIRAIANAEGKDWYEIFDILVKLAREEAAMPNDKKVYSAYLDSKYQKIPVKYVGEDGKNHRLCPYEFKARGLGKGVYIVSEAHHLTCVKDRVTEDSWDSSIKSAYKIWKVK